MKSKSFQSSSAAGTTASGPSHPGNAATPMAHHGAEQEAVVASMPFNRNKAQEYGYDNSAAPFAGTTSKMPSQQTGAGTLSEQNESAKTGAATLAGRSRRLA